MNQGYHSFKKNPKKELSFWENKSKIVPKCVSQFSWNLVGKYTGVLGVSIYVMKILLAIFLAILPKLHFYRFLFTDCRLIDQLTWFLVYKYNVVVCILMYSFKSLLDTFLVILSKMYFWSKFRSTFWDVNSSQTKNPSDMKFGM